MKKLVIITESFRIDSSITAALDNTNAAFVYFSPYYYSEKTKAIYDNMSTANANWFYASINSFKKNLQKRGFDLTIFKTPKVVETINELIEKYKFDEILIDKPQLHFDKALELYRINAPIRLIDSCLIDENCQKLTAKSRWMSHCKNIKNLKPNIFSETAKPFKILENSKSYPNSNIDIEKEISSKIERMHSMILTYGETRDTHNGQTELSVIIQNGLVDPRNLFLEVTNRLIRLGYDMSKNEFPQASLIRQFAFRELSIMRCRKYKLNLESDLSDYASACLSESSFKNYNSHVNENSTLTWQKIVNAETDEKLINKILLYSYAKGVMPNRARMYIVGWMWYNAPDAKTAHKWTLDIFNLLLLDGQCANNITQVSGAWNLQYGKVMLLNKYRVEALLNF